MADESKELQFKISTAYDGKGSQQAAADMENLTKGTQKVAESAKDSSAAQNAESDAMGGAKKAVKELDLSKRELLESMRMITEQAPILGEALRVMFNPATAAIFGIIGAVGLFETRVKNLEQSLGALELPDLSDGIRQAEDQATAWDGIAKAVGDADAAFNSVEDTQGRTLKAINDEKDALVKLLDAQKQLAIAKLDQQRQSGQITPAQYAAQKGIIEQGYSDATVQAEINARNADLAAKKKSVQDFSSESMGYKQRADAITKQFGLGKTDDEESAINKALEDQAKARQDQIDEARKNLATINAASSPDAWESLKATPSFLAHYGTASFADAQKLEQDRIDTNENAQKDIERQIAARKEAQKNRGDLLRKSSASAGKAETASDETKDQDDPNIPGTVAWQNRRDQATMQVRDITSTQTRFNTDTAGISKDLEETARIGREKNPTSDDLQKSAGAVKDAMSALIDAADAVKIMASFGQDVSSMKQEIAQIKQTMQQHGYAIQRASQYANGPT